MHVYEFQSEHKACGLTRILDSAQGKNWNDTMLSMQWIVFLMLMSLGPLNAGAQTSSAIQEGLDIITQKQMGNCVACHELPGMQGGPSTLGPTLKGVGSRMTREILTTWVKDARAIQPNTLMPPFGSTEGLNKLPSMRPLLTDAQIQKVVDTLMTWQSTQ